MNLAPAPAPEPVASMGWQVARFVPIVGMLYSGYQILNRWPLWPPQLAVRTARGLSASVCDSMNLIFTRREMGSGSILRLSPPSAA